MKLCPAKKQGYYLEFEGVSLSSKIDPITESSRLVESLSFGADDVLLLMGINPLYHIGLLLSSVKHIYVIDPRVSDYDFLLTDFSDVLTSNKVTFLKHLEGLKDLVSSNRLDRPKIVDTLKSELYDSWKRDLLKIFQAKMRSNLTENYFAITWYKNALDNLRQDKDDILFISDFKLETDKTLILLSSGVFLENDLNLIERNRQQFYVVSVVTILPYLMKKGILPDLIISSDGGYYNDYPFRFLYEECINIPMIAPLSLYRGIARSYGGEIYYYIDDEQLVVGLLENKMGLTMSKELKETMGFQFLPMNPSITINALYLMRYWQISEVFISGIDFQVLPFRYHCDGNVSEEILFNTGHYFESFEKRSYELFQKKILHIGSVWTTEVLALYKQEFDRVAKSLGVVTTPLRLWKKNLNNEKTSVSKPVRNREDLKNILYEGYLKLYDRALESKTNTSKEVLLLHRSKYPQSIAE